MAVKLTKKQKTFVSEYLETGNGTQSALKAYDTKSSRTASVIAAENLTKPNVREYLDSKAEKAAEFIFELAETSEQDNVRLGASKDILDRAGYKPVEKTLNVHANIEDSETLSELTDRLNGIYKGTGFGSDGTIARALDSQTPD